MRHDAISVLSLKQAEQAEATHWILESEALLQEAVFPFGVN